MKNIFKYDKKSEIGVTIYEVPEGYELKENEFDSLPEEGTAPYRLINGELVGSTVEEAQELGKEWLKENGYNTQPEPSKTDKTMAMLIKQVALLQKEVATLKGGSK